MSIIFNAEDHSYKSIDTADKLKWISVTTLIGLFKLPFDKEGQALKSSKNKNSRWYGLSKEEIIEKWDKANKVAVNLGSWYHNQREEDLIICDTIQRSGRDLSIIAPILDGDKKLAPSQSLSEGIYPEHMMFLRSAGICGQADRVEVIADTIDLYDYKTNKEIKTAGFKSWNGAVSKMKHVCSHLDDCNYNHYVLQLSIYMYIMLKHNPNLKPGKIVLEHVKFDIEGQDEFGNPVYKFDPNGDPVVLEVIQYDLPYLKKEVQNMIKYIQENPEILNQVKK